MKSDRDDLIEIILRLSLDIKNLTDEIGDVKDQKEKFLTKRGRQKLNSAYLKTMKAAILLMEISFDVIKTSQN
jgi:hypothetical protein